MVSEMIQDKQYGEVQDNLTHHQEGKEDATLSGMWVLKLIKDIHWREMLWKTFEKYE